MCAVIDYPIRKNGVNEKARPALRQDHVSFDGMLHQIGISPGMQDFQAFSSFQRCRFLGTSNCASGSLMRFRDVGAGNAFHIEDVLKVLTAK
jgi:hypothetical protein